jgi:hypothetical protein
LVAVFLACFRSYADILAPGELGTVMVLAADRQQARNVFGYITGLVDSVTWLADMVTIRRKESLELANGINIEVHTASYKSVRGYTAVAVVADETAFWRSEDSANPDTEVLNALRPAMATVPGSVLLAITTPYSRRGAAWGAFEKHYGQDSSVLVWKADTQSMNPNVDPSIIEAAYEDDPIAASAEYGAEFRRDVDAFLSREAIEAVTIPDRLELPRVEGTRCVAFTDPSGGSQDSFTLAIAHEQDSVAVLDAVRERRPPFSPDGVVQEFCELLKLYGVSRVEGDRYAGEWPRERFKEHGVEYRTADKTKSDIYQALLPGVNSGKVELLDHKRLKAQSEGLERRVSRGGKDSIDHGPGGRDDVCNAAAGALVRVLGKKEVLEVGPGNIGVGPSYWSGAGGRDYRSAGQAFQASWPEPPPPQ